MTRFLTRRLALVSAYLLAVAAFCAGVGWVAYGGALDQLERRGRADLALAGDSLRNELERFRNLGVFLADHPVVHARLQGEAARETEAMLLRFIDRSGSLDAIVVDRTGRTLAAANAEAPRRNHAGKPYFERAMDGALGIYHLVSDAYGRRAFLYAAPVFAEDGPVIGAVIVAVDVGRVEAEWRGDRPTIFFTDELGVIFVANRSELVFRSRLKDAVSAGRSAEYAAGRIAPLPPITETSVHGHEIWRMDGGPYVPAQALHLALDLPVIGLVGEALLDVAPARQLALLQAAVAGALCLAFGAMLFLATERRRTLAEANQRLEARVAERTSALRDLNADLQREVAERREAEARLKRAQADLVEAGKLSALGQMSAGISHELNQPLMAIRSFAENAEAFIARGKPEIAAQNLGRISDLARRMGRIIRNLRAFARQESEGLRDVDVVAVIEQALEMAAARLRAEGVTVDWAPPPAPVKVRGGEVRLAQVVLNLVSNAADAMAGRDEKRIELSLDDSGPRVVLSVRDTGPGIAEPDKVFEPFYSTKQVPSEEGMGLGLSISYGLVQSFGGHIRGRNHPAGGAVFTVELEPAARQEAA